MFAAVTSVVLIGIEPQPVRVEAHIGGANPGFHIVGLPDASVREAKERVRAAFSQSSYIFPTRRVVVNLAPADVPKSGAEYDLAIALAVLAAARAIPVDAARVVAVGELALDGSIRAGRLGLAACLVATRLGIPAVLAPDGSTSAGCSRNGTARVATNLAEAVAAALGERPERLVDPGVESLREADGIPDMPDMRMIRGQPAARRALEIAAAGGHHMLMSGSPGSGKTLLARCLPSILPRLSEVAAREVALAWAAAGRPRPPTDVPPFRAPHHTATKAALVGGGTGAPVPGEVTLAHHGTLFLDELGEFPAGLLDSLRQPIEDGEVTVARRGASVLFPSSVQVIAAANPCPCGYTGDRLVACTCSPRSRERYRRRLSGPLLDRFDLRVHVARLDLDELDGPPGEASDMVRVRVDAARTRQAARGTINRALHRDRLDQLGWSDASRTVLRAAARSSNLTARGWDRVRRVAATIADLDQSGLITDLHVSEALAYRGDP